MSGYSWQGFLFAPIELREQHKKKILSSDNWKPWGSRFGNDVDLEDLKRFLIAPLRSTVFPDGETTVGFRRTLNIEQLSLKLPAFQINGKEVAKVEWVDILVLDKFSLLILKVASTDLTLEELYTLNRNSPAWFKRHPKDRIEFWMTDDSETCSLKSWVESDVLQVEEGAPVFGDTDWFGHSLPVVSFVGDVNAETVTADDVYVDLLVGAPYGNSSYALSDKESQRIRDDQTLQTYGNWLVGDLNNRMLFYGVGDENTPLFKNLEKHYIYIALFVVYQKIMLTHLLESFMSSESKESGKVREKVLSFRKKYVLNKIATYPMGERIYQFFFKKDDVQLLLDRLTDEISASDEFERINLEKKENRVLNIIAIIAGLTLPITTVSGIYGIADKYLLSFSTFWIFSSATTVMFLFLILILFNNNK